ncbi:unknown [Odoribacter sp. CAG:788]|jgi:hypothetical protein|nr:unknown [Odoribacter sp. CAG:788]
MEKQKIRSYQPPVVEIIEIEVEKGFASSFYPWDNGGNW